MTLQSIADSPTDRLAKNSVGLAHIVFFVVAAAAPLTAVVGATPAAFAFGNGAGVPGAFVLAGILYLLFSVGFTAMSRHVGGAGAFYTYITHGIGKPAGVGGALMALVTYSAVQIAVYGLFGLFMAGAMAPIADLPWWVWSFAALVIVHVCGQRNIAFSGAILGVCMIAEIAILLLLDIGIVLAGGGPEGFGFTSFSPATVFAPGLGVALVFVVGSYIGFEATAIFGEEAENPEKTIPRATYVAVLLITVFYAFSTWAIVQFYGPAAVQPTAEAGLEAFYFTATDTILGPWASQAMNILLITSLFACVLSFHNTLNRYFFALGREGLAFQAARQGSPDARLALCRRHAAERDCGCRARALHPRRRRSLYGRLLLDVGTRGHRYPDRAGPGLGRDHSILPQNEHRLWPLDDDDRPSPRAGRPPRRARTGHCQSLAALGFRKPRRQVLPLSDRAGRPPGCCLRHADQEGKA
jgi:hypothetical protein